MRQMALVAVGLMVASGCGPAPDRVFFEAPSNANLTGTWAGTEEITTDNDITPNVNYPGTTAGGFSFPVVVSFNGGRFTLSTSNFPTSFNNDGDRTCDGVWARSSDNLQLLASAQCRALPMSTYVMGRTLPNGLSLEARTNTSGDPMASYASVHVRFDLQRE